MELKMKKLTIMRVHQFLGEGGQKKNNIQRCLPRKGGLWQFAGDLGKKREEGVFEGRGVDTPMHTMA